jgi:predicted Zn finger-like uncharacterized protein
MILTCPSCRTRYQTDSAHIKAPGRNVRCAKCGHVWFQSAPALESELEPEPVVAPVASEPDPVPETAIPDRAEVQFGPGPLAEESIAAAAEVPRRAWGGSIARGIGWVMLIVLIGGIGWAAVQYRQEIATLWPQSASLYRAIGLPANVRGVELTNVTYKQESEDGQPVLSVTGRIVNVSNREMPVPEIRVVLLDDTRHELYHWTFSAGVSTLKPGAESSFVTRLASPPAEARNLNVGFAQSGDAR